MEIARVQKGSVLIYYKLGAFKTSTFTPATSTFSQANNGFSFGGLDWFGSKKTHLNSLRAGSQVLTLARSSKGKRLFHQEMVAQHKTSFKAIVQGSRPVFNLNFPPFRSLERFSWQSMGRAIQHISTLFGFFQPRDSQH